MLESNTPSGAAFSPDVAVCGCASLFVQVTVPPALTWTGFGSYAPSLRVEEPCGIDTSTLLPPPSPVAEVGAGVVGPVLVVVLPGIAPVVALEVMLPPVMLPVVIVALPAAPAAVMLPVALAAPVSFIIDGPLTNSLPLGGTHVTTGWSVSVALAVASTAIAPPFTMC